MLKKLLLIPAVGLFAALTLGAAAAIDVDSGDAGNVGAGSGTVGGYTVTGVTWTLTAGDITGVDFGINDTDAEVDVSTDGTETLSTDPDDFDNWTCINTAGAVACTAGAGLDPASVTALDVVAVN